MITVDEWVAELERAVTMAARQQPGWLMVCVKLADRITVRIDRECGYGPARQSARKIVRRKSTEH